MIVKFFEIKKKNFKKKKFYLLYGKNEGLIEETINTALKPILPKNIFNYEEKEILDHEDDFKENVFNKSFFDNEKLIIIKRATDKIFKVIEEIINKNIDDLSLILISNTLEKKSKIRNFFEKNSNNICIPFYEDNIQTLSLIAQKFLKERNINISQHDLNILAERAKGDRMNLKNELQKIENFSINKKSINIKEILKITNLSENYDISELVDNCLSKNKKKIIKILNENNFNQEDCILILRTFLSRLKRLLKLHLDPDIKNNIDQAISSHKPPIFWKDKEIVKQQIKILNFEKTRKLVFKTNKIELLVKKNPQNSINITTDFIINQTF
jgi:DNA polymerase III subunit delta